MVFLIGSSYLISVYIDSAYSTETVIHVNL